jgi:hypothetical protein
MINGNNNYSCNNINLCDDIITNTCRANDNASHKYIEESITDTIKPSSDEKNTIPLSGVIFRYKFTADFMSALYVFSKIHQYDERNDFKESWKSWIEYNEESVTVESTRLKNLGFKGDVIDKMFKSARYYFRKKSIVKNEPQKRRQYINKDKELLNSMDRHISANIYRKDYQPKTGFDEYCADNIDVLRASIMLINEQGITDVREIEEKIKKTYKNRYFIKTTK